MRRLLRLRVAIHWSLFHAVVSARRASRVARDLRPDREHQKGAATEHPLELIECACDIGALIGVTGRFRRGPP